MELKINGDQVSREENKGGILKVDDTTLISQRK